MGKVGKEGKNVLYGPWVKGTSVELKEKEGVQMEKGVVQLLLRGYTIPGGREAVGERKTTNKKA